MKSMCTGLLTLAVAANTTLASDRDKVVKIKFIYDGTTVTGSLEDNAASREFLTMLPLTVKLEDYGSTEKIAWLPAKLRHADSRQAITPRAGDIAYYVPWGNLAIFREDFRHSPGLIKLGRIEQGFESLRKSGSESVTIVRYKEPRLTIKKHSPPD